MGIHDIGASIQLLKQCVTYLNVATPVFDQHQQMMLGCKSLLWQLFVQGWNSAPARRTEHMAMANPIRFHRASNGLTTDEALKRLGHH